MNCLYWNSPVQSTFINLLTVNPTLWYKTSFFFENIELMEKASSKIKATHFLLLYHSDIYTGERYMGFSEYKFELLLSIFH